MIESVFEKQVRDVDKAALTSLVRMALHNDDAKVVDWRFEPMESRAGLGASGIARLRGHAQAEHAYPGNEMVEWSLICKAICAKGDGISHDMTAWNYWKREALAYQSDLLVDLPHGLNAPRCYGVWQQNEQEYWLWLEDLGNSGGGRWSPEQYRVAARHLGQFNGAYLAGRPIPDLPWLSSARVRMWVEFATQNVDAIFSVQDGPDVQHWTDSRRQERVLALWQARAQLLEGLERLPRCLCHHDAYPRNLILSHADDGVEVMAAIDWAMVGTGGVGQEIASMLGGSFVFMDADIRNVQVLEEAVSAGYLSGLRDAGWQGDADLARSGYAATLALVWGVGLYMFILANNDNEENWVANIERVTGHTYTQYLQQALCLVDYALDCGDEALELVSNLSA